MVNNYVVHNCMPSSRLSLQTFVVMLMGLRLWLHVQQNENVFLNTCRRFSLKRSKYLVHFDAACSLHGK